MVHGFFNGTKPNLRELHGSRGAVEDYLAITQRKDCVAESS